MHPFIVEKLAEGRRQDLLSEAAQAEVASTTRSTGTFWFRRALGAPWQGVLLCGPMLAELAVSVALVVVIALVPLVVGFFWLPGCLMAVRHEGQRARRLIRRWTGTEIAGLYRPEPAEPDKGSWRSTYPWLLRDPATWRDLLWLFVNPLIGWVLTIFPAALVLWGLFGIVMPEIWKPLVDSGANNWYGPIHVTTASTARACAPLGVAFIVAGFALGPALLRAYGRFGRRLLAPSRRAVVIQQVAHLAESRSEVVDHQAEEIPRIERDLHNEAQARLGAMGLTLATVESFFDSDPAAAKDLLAGATETSVKALEELQAKRAATRPSPARTASAGPQTKESTMSTETTESKSTAVSVRRRRMGR